MIEIALYQPDIAPNAATIIRLSACFGLKITIIEPAGFVWSDSSFRRAGMDYLDIANLHRSPSWEMFHEGLAENQRVVLLTTKTDTPYTAFQFRSHDVLLLGRESAGVPQNIHEQLQNRVTIPMQPPARSLNVAIATAIVASEALRQLSAFKTISA